MCVNLEKNIYIYIHTLTHTYPDTFCDMPTKSKTFTLWPLMQKFADPQSQNIQRL